jgi:hypothetical protein
MRWVGPAAHMEMRNVYILVRKPKGKRPCEDLDIDGRRIMKCIFEK